MRFISAPRLGYTATSGAFRVISGLTLLVLLLMIPLLAMLPSLAFTDRLGNLPLFLFFVVLSMSVAFGSATGLLPAVALARFALRIWPINASAVPRKHCIVWQKRLAYASASIPTLLVVSLVLQRISMEGPFHPEAAADARGLIFTTVAGITGWGVTIAVAAALSSWVHSHPSYFRRRPFVLYLRRFSGFADRTIVSEVLKAAPPGAPVVFIASPQSQPRNWDPFVWAFSGLRLTCPLGSLPVQLRTSDESWEQAIAKLTSEAAAVVMDLTESSASIEKEIRLVAQHNQPERVLWLIDYRSHLPPQIGDVAGPQIGGKQIVTYHRRWAFPALAAKMGLFALVGYMLFFLVFALSRLAQGRNEINPALLLALIAVVGTWLLMGAVLLFRPSINREARQSLRRRLAVVGTKQ